MGGELSGIVVNTQRGRNIEGKRRYGRGPKRRYRSVKNLREQRFRRSG